MTDFKSDAFFEREKIRHNIDVKLTRLKNKLNNFLTHQERLETNIVIGMLEKNKAELEY